ncbi:GTPase [Salinimicrobium soli]|uniref:GTPase n=1 Tax=Salinimicrobium soli TaxID=1254399 RepID=UPI003AAA9822
MKTNNYIRKSNFYKVNEVAKYFKTTQFPAESTVDLLKVGPYSHSKNRIFKLAIIYNEAKLWIKLFQDGVKLKTNYYDEPNFDSALLSYLKTHNLEKVKAELSPELSELQVIKDFRSKVKYVISIVQRFSKQEPALIPDNQFPQEDFKELNYSTDEKQEKLNEIGDEKFVVSLLGSVNSGKSQLFNALTGTNHALVKARSGSTKKVFLYSLNKNILLADTPGLYDIQGRVSQKAINFTKENAHLILFFINSNAGITAADKKIYRKLQRLEKETIVLASKIDTLDEEEFLEVRSQIYEELGVMPFSVSVKKKVNLEQLHEYIKRISERKLM